MMPSSKPKNISTYLASRILSSLGIERPTKKQSKIVTSLLLGTGIKYEIAFHPALTDREVSCLLLAAKGKKMSEVAEILKVKFSTIETWHKKLKRKLNCRTIAQAVFEGIEYGQLQPPNTK